LSAIDMQLFIAGTDRSRDLGEDLARSAAHHKGGRRYAPEHSALSLKEAKNEAEFAERFCRLVRMRHGVSTDDFAIPTRGGWQGGIAGGIKRLLWKLLRYQHDRITYQQNVLNELLIAAIELQQKLLAQREGELTARLTRFEEELRELKQPRPGGGAGA